MHAQERMAMIPATALSIAMRSAFDTIIRVPWTLWFGHCGNLISL